MISIIVQTRFWILLLFFAQKLQFLVCLQVQIVALILKCILKYKKKSVSNSQNPMLKIEAKLNCRIFSVLFSTESRQNKPIQLFYIQQHLNNFFFQNFAKAIYPQIDEKFGSETVCFCTSNFTPCRKFSETFSGNDSSHHGLLVLEIRSTLFESDYF